MEFNNLNERLWAYVKQHPIGVRHLATVLDINQATLRRIFKGDKPTFKVSCKIEKFLADEAHLESIGR